MPGPKFDVLSALIFSCTAAVLLLLLCFDIAALMPEQSVSHAMYGRTIQTLQFIYSTWYTANNLPHPMVQPAGETVQNTWCDVCFSSALMLPNKAKEITPQYASKAICSRCTTKNEHK